MVTNDISPRALVAMAVLATTACSVPYKLGAITRSPRGTLKPNAEELRCIDVVVHPVARELAESFENESSVHVVYQLGNHCGQPALVDFAAPVVEAMFSDDRRTTLEPVPVEGKQLSAVIDAYASGAENIGYLAVVADGAQQAQRTVVAFCVDASRLESGVTGVGRPACFRRLPDGQFAFIDATRIDEVRDSERALGAVATLQPSAKTVDSDSGMICTDTPSGPSWCDRFARWKRMPPLTVGMGLSTHHFDLAHRVVAGGDVFGAPASVRATALGYLQAETFDLTIGGFVRWPFYVGAEAQLGGSAIGRTAVFNDNPHFGVDSGGAMVGGGVTIGVASPRLGPLSAQLDMYAGGAVLFLGEDAASAGLPDGCGAPDAVDGCTHPSVSTWVLEPRLRVHVWITPWWSADGWGGVGMISGSDWSSGLSVTFHARSFDGGG